MTDSTENGSNMCRGRMRSKSLRSRRGTQTKENKRISSTNRKTLRVEKCGETEALVVASDLQITETEEDFDAMPILLLCTLVVIRDSAPQTFQKETPRNFHKTTITTTML